MVFEDFEAAAEKIIVSITSTEDSSFKENISECLETVQDR